MYISESCKNTRDIKNEATRQQKKGVEMDTFNISNAGTGDFIKQIKCKKAKGGDKIYAHLALRKEYRNLEKLHLGKLIADLQSEATPIVKKEWSELTKDLDWEIYLCQQDNKTGFIKDIKVRNIILFRAEKV